MQKEHFTLTIIKSQKQIAAICNSNIAEKNLTRYLAEILKEKPELIPIFLDATGLALMTDTAPELTEAERLAILQNIPLVSEQ